LKSLESVPLIRAIQEQTEQMRGEELEKARRYMKDLSDEQNEMVERFSRALMKRFMHPTLRTLKTLPDDIEGDLLMGAARRLFEVDQASPKQVKESDEQTSG
jgi:glutamyl-tRNA reductase